jgi:predicted MFS family arabinose efflux permease
MRAAGDVVVVYHAGQSRVANHWQVPATAGVDCRAGAFPLERRGYLRAVFLTSIGLIMVVQLGFMLASRGDAGLAPLSVLLFVFFCGFNVLEATQPSMVSRVAPEHARGTAMGVYNTLQSLGFFVGGVAGGWLAKNTGGAGLFVAALLGMLAWLVVAWPMSAVAPKASIRAANPG